MPTSSTSTVSPTTRAGPSTGLSPSPITFARASFISLRRGSDESTITGVNLHDDNRDGDHDRDDKNEDTSSSRVNMLTPVAQKPASSMGVIAAALSRSSPSALDRAAKQNEEARARLSEFLQRASEASPRAGPACSFSPSLVVPDRSPSGDSVTLTIEGVSVELDFPRPPSAGPISPSPSNVNADRQEQTPRCRSRSPTTSPSTPGFPLTPASSEDGFVLPAIAPLSITKPRSPSPSHSASASSSCAGSPPQSTSLAQHASTSKPRIASRRTNKNAKRLSRLFANGPAPLDTAAANRLARVIQDQSGAEPSLTLTGVLAEVAEEAARAKQVREEAEAYTKLQSEQKENKAKVLSVDPADSFEEEPIPKGPFSEEAEVDDETAWIDVDVDDEEGRDYYRSDIATHLQLFSSIAPFAPGASLHRRGSSSASSMLRQQFPPARPDSMPLPPHLRLALPTIFDDDEGDVPPVPTLPPLTPCSPAFAINNTAYGRRGSAASLASNTSARSTGSQKSGRGSSSSSNRRHSRARVSASVNVGRRRRGSSSASLTVPGGNGSRMKSLPPTPTSAGSNTGSASNALGPSALLDPNFSLASAPTRNDKPTRPPRMSRPPPRFSLPIDVAGEDEEFLSPLATRPRQGLNMGAMGLSSMLEVDEEQHGSAGVEEGRHPFARPEPVAPSKVVSLPTSASAKASSGRSPRSQVASLKPLSIKSTSPSTLLFVPSSPVTPVSISPEQAQFAPFTATSKAPALDDSPVIDISFDKTINLGLKNDNCDNSTTNDDTDSVFHDGEGRILRSRWSTSTFASTAITPGPSTGRSGAGSATRQFFPRLPSLPTALQLPSRLKRSNANSSGSPRNSGERERPSPSRSSLSQRSTTADPPQVLPFPFFPTPTPPSPKRANNPGPGKYVPKPELRLPPRERAPRESSDSTASTIKARVSSEGSNGVQYARYRSNTASTAQPSPALSSTSYTTSGSSGSGNSSFSYHTTTSASTFASGVPSSTFSSSSSARPLLLASSPTSPDDGDALSAFPFTLSSTVSAAIGSASTTPTSASGADELGRNVSRGNNKGKGAQQLSPVSAGFSLGRKSGGGGSDRRKKELVSLRGKPVPAEILTW